MSTLAMFEKRGEKRGEKKRDVKIAINMHKNGFTIQQIAVALDKDENFVKKAIESEAKKK